MTYIILSIILIISNPVQSNQNKSNKIDRKIDFLSIHIFDKSGKLIQNISAPSAVHLNNHKINQINQPLIYINQDNKIKIQSDKAIISEQGDEINFQKNVKIISTNKQEDSILNTEEFTYFPKEQRAITLKNVSIINKKSTITAQGLQAFLNTQKIEFLHKIKGVYNAAAHNH